MQSFLSRQSALPLALALTVGTAALPAPQGRPEAAPTPAQRAVRGAIEDYVLGFYEAAPERLERALSPELSKLGYWRPGADEAYGGLSRMTYEEALALAGSWNADGQQGADLAYSIELFDVADKTAAGMLQAVWGQDYMQLIHTDEGWRILHVLWQSEPPAVPERSEG